MMEIRADDSLRAGINPRNGQLCSLYGDGHEYMWGGGKPRRSQTREERNGWQGSAPIMFPVVGPVSLGYLNIGRDVFPMPQHGYARHLVPELAQDTFNTVHLRTRYDGGRIDTPKGTAHFPWKNTVDQTLSINDGELTAGFSVTNASGISMPYAFGWHPGFRAGPEAEVATLGETLTIGDIRDSPGGVIVMKDRNFASMSDGERAIALESNMPHTMLWAPEGQDLLCIEPITTIPSPGYRGQFGEMPGVMFLGKRETEEFEVTLKPE